MIPWWRWDDSNVCRNVDMRDLEQFLTRQGFRVVGMGLDPKGQIPFFKVSHRRQEGATFKIDFCCVAFTLLVERKTKALN